MLAAHYDWTLVWLSLAVAICASYTALDLAGRTAGLRGRPRALWVSAGAASMGLGIWGMHYIGMLAYRLPVAVSYSLPLVGASMLAAIASSAVALFVVSRSKLSAPYLVGGSLIMGAGIAAMHYIGMAAVHLAGFAVYQPVLVASSLAIAVVVSGTALYLAYSLRDAERNSAWSRPVSAIVMGLAIAGMHYTGMAAVCFHKGSAVGGGNDLVNVSSLGIFCIASVTLAVLALTLIGSLTNRRFLQQQLLLDSEVKRWSLVISASQDGLFDVDLVTGISYRSPRWMTMLGYEPGDHASVANWEELLHPEERAGVLARRTQYLAGGAGSDEVQFRLRHRDGSWRWILCRAQAVWDQQGQPLRLTGSHKDVTERVHHEDRLRASEGRYRDLFEHNPLPGWIYTTKDLRFMDVNEAAVDQFGWSREEFLGTTVAAVRMPGEAEAVEAELSASALGHRRAKAVQHRRNQRSNIWVELRHQDLEIEGQAARLVMANDITARIDAENALRQTHEQMEMLVLQRTAEFETSEARWRGLIEALPSFISMTTPEGLLTYVSSQVEEYSGIPTAELLSGGLLQLVHPEDRAGVESSLRAGFQTGIHYDIEFRLRSKEGLYRWFLSRGRPIYQTPGGPVREWLRSTTDIDDRKRHEERLEVAVKERTVELAEALDRAQCAVQTKSDFLATMSHEIRTPMNGVIGMTHLMLDTPLTSTQRGYLDTIRSSGQALLAIINDILDFSKMEAGKMELLNEDFDLRTALEDAIELVSPAAKEKQLRLSLDMDEISLRVVGDAGRLRQVLLNLVSNAVKFTADGSVQISVSQDPALPNLLRFSVHDSGIGLSPEQQDSLFQPFTQADRSTTRSFGGTGLGLSIAKRLVELMGGQIGVVSRLGAGSTFWFTLPLPCGKAPDAQPAALAPRPNQEKRNSFKNIFAGSRARVLVADDVVSNQLVAKGMLRELGLRADAVSDGAGAIAALKSTAYDLILMDVHMPKMDGLEATRRIRAIPSYPGCQQHRLPIIALTASAMSGDRQRYLEAGMDDLVSKPIMPAELVKVLKKWLPPEPDEKANQNHASGPAISSLSTHSPPTLDIPGLLRRLMGDESLAMAVMDGFAEDMPEQVQSLVRSAHASSVAELASVAHQIRGAAATIGGEALRAVATEMEAAARAGNLGGARACVANLEKQFLLLMEAIAAHHLISR
jgi:PAS domain S-box-containing protein